MTGEELTLGQIGLSVVLVIILQMVYGTLNVPAAAKPWIAVGIGIALSIVALYYYLPAGQSCTFKMAVDYVVRGFMSGATAVGLREISKARARDAP
jgi:hypothetical protein